APHTDWKQFVTEKYVPFLFLEKDNEIYAYVETGDLKGDVSFAELLERAIPLEMVGVLEDRESISLPFIFQTLGDPITLIKENNDYSGYIRREDLLVELLREEGNNTNLLKIMLASIPMGIFIVNTDRQVVNGNEAGLRMMKQSAEQVMHRDA